MSTITHTAGSKHLDALMRISRVVSHDESAKGSPKNLFPIILLAVFFIALLLSLVCGVLVYKHVTNLQTAANTQREGLELICNVVRANDSTGSVAVGNGPEGKALVIVEALSTGNYETRIYLHDGKIVQEYSLAESPYTPEKASTITESGTFSFSYANGLLNVETDQGSAEIALRHLQGGE